jgi:hypothetical protein
MIIHNPILTGSFTVNGTDVASITSSAASITAINSYTASQNILNGTYATTGSNTFRAPQTINSNLIVTGSITAQTLVVQTVSSSVIYSSGSNVFGNNIANTQVFTGSVSITGSLAVTTGSVGIGVNPYSNTPLSIKGTYGLWIERGATNDSGLSIYHDGTNALLASSYQSTGAFGGLALYTSNLQRLTITAAGNVGIGTNSPFGKFHVFAGTNLSFLVQDSGTTDTIELTNYSSANGVRAITLNGSVLTFATGTAGGGSVAERMKIATNGTVTLSKDSVFGINTNDGSDNGYLALCGASGDGDNRGGHIYLSGNERGADPGTVVLASGNVANGAVVFRTGATLERMRINNAGKITYGSSTYFTTNYSGGFVFNSSTDAFNNFIISDNGNATLRGALTQNASDERLKNNIQIIPNAIEKISQLKGVTFEWNKEIYETSRTTDIGVIAQDVQKVLPDAVTLAPFDTNIENNTSKSGENYLTVYYEKLIPLLIEGIKELQAQITELKNK